MSWSFRNHSPITNNSNKPCRNCKHNISGHFKRHGEIGFVCVHCTCKDYVPYDNLPYLEWKYDQKL